MATFLDQLRKKLTSEQVNAIEDAMGDDFDWNFIPRARLQAVTAQRNELRSKLARLESQLGEGALDDNDDLDDEGRANPTSQEAKKSKDGSGGRDDTSIAVMQQKHAQEMAALKLGFAALTKLREAKVHDAELLWESKYIDKSKITLDDKTGEIKGLDDQITALQQSHGYMFSGEQNSGESGTGRKGAGTPEDAQMKALDLSLATIFGQDTANNTTE